MATNNAVNTGLAGSTGTGAFVGSTSPILVAPNLGAATATSLTFSPTTSGMIGTPTNNSATAGIVGEIISGVVLAGNAIALTSTVAANLTSIILTPGDWDVRGNMVFGATGGNLLLVTIAMNTVSVTFPDNSFRTVYNAGSGQNGLGLDSPYRRFNVSVNTTIFFIGRATFTGTGSFYGRIDARRVR